MQTISGYSYSFFSLSILTATSPPLLFCSVLFCFFFLFFVLLQDYDRVLIDTAPTGHTLRLLAAPDFLDGFLGKLSGLRGRLDGLLGMGAG